MAPADFAGTATFWDETADNFNDGDGVDLGTATAFVTVTGPASVELQRRQARTQRAARAQNRIVAHRDDAPGVHHHHALGAELGGGRWDTSSLMRLLTKP